MSRNTVEHEFKHLFYNLNPKLFYSIYMVHFTQKINLKKGFLLKVMKKRLYGCLAVFL